MSELLLHPELKPKLPETLIIPDDLQKEILSSTSQILSCLLERNSQGQFNRKPGAPQIVAILDRSGTLAASGIVDFFQRHQIGDPIFKVLKGIGSERAQDCGGIFNEDDVPSSTQQDVDDFKTNFINLAQTEGHPLHQDLETLTQALTTTDSSEGMRIGVIDDFVAKGQTTRVMMPTLIQLAAERSGKSPDITEPSMDDLIQHYIDDEPHTNRDKSRTIAPETVSYHPEEDVMTIFQNPNCAHWQSQITQASFNASPIELGYLNEALKGPNDSSTPRLDAALQSGIEIFGGQFTNQNPQTSLSQKYPDFTNFETKLPTYLSSTITKLTQANEEKIIASIQLKQ